MKDRIKRIRKEHGLTQQAFADQIGISRGNVAAYEVGKNAPSDAVISLICREFNVNEEWLRTGTGDMFVEVTEDDLFSLAAASLVKNNDVLAMEGLKLYYKLNPEGKAAATAYILSLADAIRARQADQEKVPAPEPIAEKKKAPDPAADLSNLSIDQKVALYRQELEREEKAEDESEALPENA
ncbi:MAG: helix-turn-helix domain-containing protein [bacterium]|nr:helix-turn-helix domain-containing protein [bacterium]MCM1500948.1 helix-turn-helix domain-containing protein [Clostridium sp.]